MVLRVLGTGVTDSDGKVSVSYTGAGVGVVDFVASAEIDGGSVVSEPFVVWDTLFYDNGGQNVNKWDTRNASGLVISYPNNEYTQISNTNQTQGSKTHLLSSATLTGDVEAIIEVNIPSYVTNVGQYFGLRTSDGTKQRLWRATQTGWRYYKIRRVNGVFTGYVKVNESDDWQTMNPNYDSLGNEDGLFDITIYNPREEEYSIQFKNLKVYSI